MKRVFYLAMGIALNALVFAVLYTLDPRGKSNGEQFEELPELELPQTPVVVDKVQNRDFVRSISSEGFFKANIESRVVAQVSGQIVSLNIEEGSFVREGGVLLKINAKPYRIVYLKAKDHLTRALREYAALALLGDQFDGREWPKKELPEIVDSSNVDDLDALALLSQNSRKTWIATRIGLTQARLDVDQAKLNLDNTVIRARFDAYVTELEVGAKSAVEQGQMLMRLVALEKLTLEVGILESELRLAHIGAGVSIRPHAFPGERIGGTIKAISPVVDPESGTCVIKIGISNAEHRIKPGMFAKVDVETRVYKKRLLIPRDALLIRDDRKLVFVHESGLAKWRYVKTGLENNEFVEIKEGLNEGEELIISGHFNLAHDARVVVGQR